MSEAQFVADRTTVTIGSGSGETLHDARVTISESNFDAIGIAELVSLWREAGGRQFRVLDCHETGAVVQIGGASELSVDRISSLPPVDSVTTVAEGSHEWVYVVQFTAGGFPSSIVKRRDDVFESRSPELHDEGLTLSLVGLKGSIAAVVDEFETNGLTPDIQRFGQYTGHEGPLETLTDRQRDVVTTAYEMGYYDVPRTVCCEAVADELGLDPSTVVEHLQRAERNVLAHHFSPTRCYPPAVGVFS